MQRLCLFAFLMLFFHLAQGQKDKPAIAKTQINAAKTDLAKLDSIEKYAPELYRFGHFEDALVWFQEGLDFVEKEEIKSKYSFFKINVARCYNRRSDEKTAIKLGLEALADFDSTSTTNIVFIATILSHFYIGSNQLDSALYYNYFADSIELLNVSPYRYKTLIIRSNVYEKQGLNDLAVKTAEISYEIVKEDQDTLAKLWVLHQLRSLTENTKYIEKYSQYSRDYMEIMKTRDSSKAFHRGTFELANKSLIEQIEILEKVTDYYRTDYYKHGYNQSLESLTELYVANEQYEDAYRAIIVHEPLILQQNFANSLYEFYLRKYKTEKALGLYTEATGTADEIMRLRDTLLNEEIIRQNLDLTEKYETKAKDQEIELLNKNKELSDLRLKRSSFTKWILTIGICSLLFFSLYLFNNIQQKKKTNKILAEQKEIIQSNLLEKETLLKEIHHRVKNNLQIISSLLRLQSRSIEDPSTKEALLEGQNRVQSMALIHQNLYKEDNLSGVEVKKYFENLCQNLLSTYKLSSEEIKLELEIDPIELDVSTIIPIGLIVNELFTNSLKYAFEQVENPKLGAKLEEKNGLLFLEIYDNGTGISDSLVTYLNKQKGRNRDSHWGFGTRLLQTFAQKLDAEIIADNKFGTKILLQIKNYEIVRK